MNSSVEARAAERAGGDLPGRHLDHRVEHAVGGVAAHRAAVVERDPDAALRVDRQAVGPAASRVRRTGGAGQARVGVVVEDVDAVVAVSL